VQGETEQRFRALLQSHPDSTLDELRALFREKAGISLSRAAPHRTARRCGFTRKKKSAYAQERDRPDIKKNGKISRRNAQAGKAIGSFL
jgi:transposase